MRFGVVGIARIMRVILRTQQRALDFPGNLGIPFLNGIVLAVGSFSMPISVPGLAFDVEGAAGSGRR